MNVAALLIVCGIAYTCGMVTGCAVAIITLTERNRDEQ